MNLSSAMQYLLFLGIVTTLVKPLGGYMERVFPEKRTALDRLCRPVERLIYRVGGVDSSQEMTASNYATCFLFFGVISTLLLFLILRLQNHLAWFYSAYHTTRISPDLAWNAAISFSTTTTWQAYAGENTMTYFSQIVGLCAQNFLAGAAGLAVGIAFIRGLARQLSSTLGNFWVDVTRGLLWILLPGALAGALLLVWQGVPMDFIHMPWPPQSSMEGRQFPRDRSLHWKLSRIWAPMVGDSSTRTGRIRTKIPPAWQIFWKCWPLFSCPQL
jgi:K+-transporting ATPase ATPase A chain